MGGFGILIGLLVILWHMMTLRTLGQNYISTMHWSGPQQLLNVFIRAPIQYLNRASQQKQGADQAPQTNE
ncbi:hypothetical protein D3C85_1717710 [compost metagenome]